MKNKDYIPSEDAKFVTWVHHFIVEFILGLVKWAIPEHEGTKLNELLAVFDNAYRLATGGGTRTKASVKAKNEAKKALIAAVRRVYKMYIIYNELVTNPERDVLGVPIHSTSHTPAPEPTTAPTVVIDKSVSFKHKISVRQEGEDHPRKGLPEGVSGFEVWSVIGDFNPEGLNDYRFVGQSTTYHMTVTYDESFYKKTATYRVRWVNRRNVPGPWSIPTSVVIS